MITYKQVFENNKKWVEQHATAQSSFFDQLAKGQNPDFLIIACSDSRVAPENFTGAQPGELFVHRNIANVVDPEDPNMMSVLEYAVEHLKVKYIVVCGHTFCGGVKASMQAGDEGKLNTWLNHIRKVSDLHQLELQSLATKDEKYNRLIELNVKTQCETIKNIGIVKKSITKTGFPEVHGWLYHLENGKLSDLNISV